MINTDIGTFSALSLQNGRDQTSVIQGTFFKESIVPVEKKLFEGKQITLFKGVYKRP